MQMRALTPIPDRSGLPWPQAMEHTSGHASASSCPEITAESSRTKIALSVVGQVMLAVAFVLIVTRGNQSQRNRVVTSATMEGWHDFPIEIYYGPATVLCSL
jgi:hypothetical protein